ncbi:MAG TPA: acyl-CoA dehydrogenase family protein [Gemmataceae bacterium]|jgi:alkylation response protein AidB-like acyl-CoA dehydrogenase|nr:acyl-CoA dehydrogenase family protein [Gemmataceae bacterium]
MPTQERERLLADVEAFCQEIRPIEELCYVEHRFNDQVLPLGRKYGLLGMSLPESYGGRPVDAVTYLRALTRIGREGTGVRTFFSGHISIGAYPVLAWGNEEQKRRYLPAAAKGDKIFAFGLTEPEAGSNPLEMQSTYERRGDHFVLNGVKYLISNGGIADVIITFAYPKGGKGRVSAFILETKGPGFAHEDLTAKMGMPTSNTAMFEMTDCVVPAANLLGPEGEGFRVAMGTLTNGRLSVAAGCLGVIEDCLAEALQYAKDRHQHGKPIAKHQLVQEHLAAIEMDRLASESILLRAAEAKDAAGASGADAAVKSRADMLSAQAKLFASNAAWDAADRAVQVFGGRGWSTLYRPGRHLQDVRVCRIYEGTDEILKLKVAAAILGKEYEAFK